MASSDKNKKKSSGGGSSAARKSAAARKAGGGSPAAKPAKSQKAGGSRWARARQSAKAGAAKSSAAKGEKRGLGKFLKDVRVELRKVTWPTRKDLFQSTVVVIVAVAIAGAYTGALDYIFSSLVKFIQDLIS